ncbi:MAG: hypothetical protein V3U87_07105 [Methylococcaceae bacterium]|jgi:hypothetical protein
MKQERKKRSLRRYTKIDKLEGRKYHVHDLNTIVKVLYPHRVTINKYKNLLEQTTFTTSQKELIVTTAHSLTIVNEMYRDQDKYGKFYITREDMINAIYMLQNELHLPKHEYLLSPYLRWFYKELQLYFDGRDFTNKDIRQRLGRSASVINQNLRELVDREFIEIIDRKKSGFMYRIKSRSL